LIHFPYFPAIDQTQTYTTMKTQTTIPFLLGGVSLAVGLLLPGCADPQAHQPRPTVTTHYMGTGTVQESYRPVERSNFRVNPLPRGYIW
jgi:hypothetical protein